MTGRQELFVAAYLDCLNATEAASRAGYSGDRGQLQTIGNQNLLKLVIRQAIDEGMSRHSVSGDWVIERLRRLSESDDERIQLRALDVLARHLLKTWTATETTENERPLRDLSTAELQAMAYGMPICEKCHGVDEN